VRRPALFGSRTAARKAVMRYKSVRLGQRPRAYPATISVSQAIGLYRLSPVPNRFSSRSRARPDYPIHDLIKGTFHVRGLLAASERGGGGAAHETITASALHEPVAAKRCGVQASK